MSATNIIYQAFNNDKFQLTRSHKRDYFFRADTFISASRA